MVTVPTGLKATATCDYRVGVDIEAVSTDLDTGELLRAPAGRSIPITWRFLDANGDKVGLDEVGDELDIRSWVIACDADTGESSPETDLPPSNDPFELGNGDIKLIWKTERWWGGSCRRLDITAAGDTASVAYTFR